MKQIIKLVILSLISLPTLAIAEDAAKDKEKQPPAPSEYLTKFAPFKITVELDGFFAPTKEHKISLTPKAWTDMTIVTAMQHGQDVKKGDKLVTLETKKLSDAIEAAEKNHPSIKLAHDILEAELKSLEKTTPKTIQNTKRAKQVADEKWQYYEKTGHAEAIRATELSLHFAQQSYDYAKEEYEQLQKMYEADDLTEETEEIILRRAKSSFERASESLRLSKMRIDRELKITLPEQLKSNRAQNEMNEITHQDAMINLPRTLQQKRFDFEKSRRDLNKIEENLEKMKTDLNSFNVTSPTDGVLFYGMNKDGKWLTSAAVAKKLIPGGKLAAHEVFMTVIKPGALKLIAAIPEPKLANLKDGMVTHITPVSNPTLNLNGKIEKVNRVPGAYQLTTSIEGKNEGLLPGMSAKLKIIAANYDKAITVPNNLINGDTVKVLVNDEKVDKKIKKGPSDGKVTVIIEGLAEGEKIVAN